MLTPPPERFGGDPIPLVLVGVLVLALLVQLLLPPVPASLPRGAAGVLSSPQRVRPLAAPAVADPAADQALALARPLFSPDRSSRPADAGDAGATLALLGVASLGARAVASLRDGSGAIVSLRPGGVLDGWTLEAVTRDAAVLRQGGQARTLRVGQTAGLSPDVASSRP